MTQDVTIPSYDQVADEINDILKIKYQASELHGLICGLICVFNLEAANKLPKYIGDKNHLKSTPVLEHLYNATFEQIQDFSFDFNLLLPDDETNLKLRAEALTLWCQGFLTPLLDNKKLYKDKENDEVTTAINDISEVAKINYDEISENEEDEEGYFELVEYVRLAVLMIFYELNPKNP